MTKIKEEHERIRQKTGEAHRKAYENMRSVFNDNEDHEGINAILKFLNERERVDEDLPLSEQIKYAEDTLFIKTRYVKLDDDWYKTALIPMMVKTSGGHWLAVIPNTDGTCYYIDRGRRIKITLNNAKNFTTEALCFYKGMRSGRITMRDLIGFMVKCVSVKDRIMVLLAGILAVFAGMLLPWANSFIFAKIIPAGELSAVSGAASLIFSAVSIAAVLNLLQSLILTNSMLKTSAYMQSGIFSRLLSLKPEFFKNTKSGELSQMIMELSDISKIVSARSVSACIGVVLSLVYLVEIYIYAPHLFGWVILVTLVLSVLIVTEGVLNSKWLKGYSASLSKMSGFSYELFSGIEAVKLGGAEAKMMERWSRRYLDASRKADKPFFLKYTSVFYKLLTVLSTAAIFLSGARLSASNYIAFSAAYGAYMAASLGVAVIIEMVSAFRSMYAIIEPVLEGECEEYGKGMKQPQSFRGEITVSDLCFGYDKNAPYVINGLSAHIQKGESIGIIGPSGCGKSTLVRLLLGFETLDSGSIYIDEFDIRELDLRSYRRKIGVVLQNSGLISGDIYSNITITNPEASMEDVQNAVEMAGLSQDIAALPMGLRTPVSEENCTLSGGQRQRLLIARALISKPSIIIFDEATSALDNITQAKITESINKLDCTKIIVAHRLSTIESCDRIFVMDKGTIVEEGTFDELKNADGLFKKLIKRQNVEQ